MRSVKFSILINGCPKVRINASRGLRQGDPLSPFLIFLVVDVLTRMVSKSVEGGIIKGL